MSALPYSSKLARWAAWPRHALQLRLTALFGAFGLALVAGLLMIADILAGSWPRPSLRPVLMSPAGGIHGSISAVPHPVLSGRRTVESGPWRNSTVPHPAITAPADRGSWGIAGGSRLGPAQATVPAHVAAGHAVTFTQLLTEGAIALGAIAVVSVALGWLITRSCRNSA